MRFSFIALIVFLIAVVLSAGATVEMTPLSISPLKNPPPCHRRNQPTQPPASHQCCQGGLASVPLKILREELPGYAATDHRGFLEKFEATEICHARRCNPLQPGETPAVTQLRI